MVGHIIDISHHQDPQKIDYEKLCSQLDLAIIRVQFGSKLVDRHYKTHIAEMKKYNVPFGVYAWVRGKSQKEMEVEAQYFYNRAKDLDPLFYVLDVEEKSMADMRAGVNAYVEELRSLTDKKIGVYIGHHVYKEFNIDVSKFDFVWLPRYGPNNGKPHNFRPAYPCDLWQYTDKGRLEGYGGYLDLNMLTGTKPLEFFLGTDEPSFWAQEAWQWAKKEGLIDGTRSKEPLTREEMATILKRFYDKFLGAKK